MGGFARRFLTLRTMGIAGAVAGAVALVVPMLWSSLFPEPFATIDSPRDTAWVPRCFIVRGRVDPATITRPLWLIKGEAGEGWREVGRVYPPPGSWGSRVCARGDRTSEVRLALVLADDELDAKLSGPPVAELEPEMPDWLSGGCYREQQGGCGRRQHGFPPLPAGATPVAPVVTVRVPTGGRDPYLASKGPLELPPPAPETGWLRERHTPAAHRARAVAP